MPVLSAPDATVGIACALPVLETADRLDSLQDLVAGNLGGVLLDDRRLRIAIECDEAADLYVKTVAWAEAEKGCCPYLGFAVEETPATLVLEIAAPAGAEPTLEALHETAVAAAEPLDPRIASLLSEVRSLDEWVSAGGRTPVPA